jgi:hypothetical protein
MVIENDVGSFGRKTKTYIALSPTQIKSSVENSGTFTEGTNIRYSADTQAEGDSNVNHIPGRAADQRQSGDPGRSAQDRGVSLGADAGRSLAGKSSERIKALGEAIAERNGDERWLSAFKPANISALPKGGQIAAQAVKELFGVDVQAFRENHPDSESAGTPLAAGVFLRSMPDVLFVAADRSARKSHMAITFHEAMHQLEKQHPDVYREMLTKLRPLMQNTEVFRADLLSREGKILGQAHWEGELMADLLGDRAIGSEFWGKLAAKEPSLFRKVADTLLKYLRLMKNWLTAWVCCEVTELPEPAAS